MMYGSWDIKCIGQSFLSVWAIFCPLTLTTQKLKTFKKIKKCLEILSLYTCVQWDINGDKQNFLSFWTILPFYPPNNQENQNFEKMKKTGDILTLHEYHKRKSYEFWDKERNRQNFFSFWTIFCSFSAPPPPNNPENQNFEKWRKHLQISSFYARVP